MKLKIVTLFALAALATSVFGQGILLQNIGTGNQSATANGAVYMPDGTLFNGLANNLGVVVMGGPSAGSLSPMGPAGGFTVANDPKGYTGLDMGVFQLGAAGAEWLVPGVAAGGTAWIRLQIWFDGPTGGLFSSYAAAEAGSGLVGTVLFSNLTSNPPLVPDQPLSGMPSVTLAIVPEPSTLALGALGLASLLALRRRN